MTARDAGADGRPAGRLWVVATPLGNLGDITARAREAIAECDLVACEDTRVTGGLLRHLDISKPMLAYHEHKVALGEATKKFNPHTVCPSHHQSKNSEFNVLQHKCFLTGGCKSNV